MNIAYTYHSLNSKVGGVARYFAEIIKQLKFNNNIYFAARYSKCIYFAESIQEAPGFLKYNFRGKSIIERWLQNSYLRTFLKKNKKRFDLIHLTGEDPYIFKYVDNTPVVITIHDMTPELFYKETKRIENRKICIENSSEIICVSKNTRNDLLKIYPEINPNKIHVIYHGYNNPTIAYGSNLYGDYILYVGSRYSYKNFNFFLESICKLLKERNLKLICTGEQFTKEEMLLINKLESYEFVLNLGFIDDNVLNTLYHYAKCFVYPSLHEGFGMPILEAFSNKCPVCLSNLSCFPEIAQDAASYFNPNDSISICESITKTIDNVKYRNQLILNGTERLQHFSWKNAVNQTIEVYNKAVLIQ